MSIFTIPTRRIGNDNVSAIGFGAMGIGNFGYGTELNQDDETRFKNDSEDLIGKWFKRTGKRDQASWLPFHFKGHELNRQ
ncbi:hypothetical protein FRC08_013613 [Ceratobasidium sp. 394]|nr:hypothetical protein FRC08_013613 [Ceratobasidium sp. 394]